MMKLLCLTSGPLDEALSYPVRVPNREFEAERQRVRTLKNKRLSSAEKRAEALGVLIERINRAVLYELHEGTCGICGQRVSERKFTIDHVVPLSRGSIHAYANVAPAHGHCNRWKADRMPEDIEGLRPPAGKRRKQSYRNRPPAEPMYRGA